MGAIRGVGEEARTGQRVLVVLLVALVLLFVTVVHNPSATGFHVRWFVDDVTDLAGIGGPNYAFLHVGEGGQPAHWDRCKPIYYTVNPLSAPAGWESMVEDAVIATSEASGYEFRNAGTTDERELTPGTRGYRAPVLIMWADSSEAPVLSGERVGYGSFLWLPQGDQLEATSGTVVLDADDYAQMPGTEHPDEMVLILAHQLGHVLGLDHVDDIDELMHSTYAGQDGFGSGDIEGFEILRDQPCQGESESTQAAGTRHPAVTQNRPGRQ